MTIDLQGQTILVTGASRGIGRAIAQKLLDSGGRVLAHFNRTPPDISGAETLQADLASVDQTEDLFDRASQITGRLDCLVLNAGIAHSAPIDAPLDIWLERWQETIAVNLRASEHLTRRMISHVRGREGLGRIIYVASRAAFRGDTPDYLAYAASKAGMVAIARSVARGCGKDGIRSFVIAPGFTRTEMAQEFIDQYGEEFASKDVATERMTEPNDIAPLVVMLASGLADHATGCTIDINAASYVR
jgi:3-oxoacyl-[acyl-carrier protein] reductase